MVEPDRAAIWQVLACRPEPSAQRWGSASPLSPGIQVTQLGHLTTSSVSTGRRTADQTRGLREALAQHAAEQDEADAIESTVSA